MLLQEFEQPRVFERYDGELELLLDSGGILLLANAGRQPPERLQSFPGCQGARTAGTSSTSLSSRATEASVVVNRP